MPAFEDDTKQFDTTPRQELEGYARDFGISDASTVSDTELRKRLREIEAPTGTAAESDGPVIKRGDPGRGPHPGR